MRDYEMRDASDRVVWDFAKDNEFTIVSKDADFHHLSFARGAPPRVVRIIAFHRDPDAALLVLT